MSSKRRQPHGSNPALPALSFTIKLRAIPFLKTMKYFIFTLGCQMNVSDSERIATILEREGCKASDEKNADLIIVNACSVRQKAVDRIWGKIKIWQPAGKKIVLTGCVLPSDKKKFAKKGIEYTDFHNDNFFDIIPHFTPACRQTRSHISYIPIMTGCDNFCSYCAVPLTRGREKSRPIRNVISDIKRALENGSKEILLLGQNVNSYKFGFGKLLKKIDNLPCDFKFNFISSNPHDMTDELIETFAQLKKWPRELHLPLQSGDGEVLKKMNRKYTSNQYLKLVANLKSQISNLKITTDIIVGFPDESKEQFQNTIKLCKKMCFDKAYIAQYSPRPGTASAKLIDDVSKTEKKRRWLILENLINK